MEWTGSSERAEVGLRWRGLSEWDVGGEWDEPVESGLSDWRRAERKEGGGGRVLD